MFRTRGVLLVTIVLAMSVVFVSAASAKIAFEWKVNGKALTAGEQRTFGAGAESTFDIKGSVAGVAVLLLSTQLKVESGSRIIGGKPGTGEQTIVFENVTVDKPANCEVESLPSPVAGVVRTQLLKTELVEGQTSHEPLLLITPKTGSTVAELRFLGASCVVKNQEVKATGSIAADPLPHLAEALTGLVDFESSQGNHFLLSTGGALETAGLIFGGNPATIGGNECVTLTSDENAGAF
jgi:hypothetical protein